MSELRSQEDFTYFEITRTAENNTALQRMLAKLGNLGATILEPEMSPAVVESRVEVMDKESEYAFEDRRHEILINGIHSSRLRVYEPENIKLPLLRYKVPSNAKHASGFRRAAQRVIYDLKDPSDATPHDRRKGRPPGELRKRLMQASLRYDIIESKGSYLPPIEWNDLTIIPDHLTDRWELVLLPNPRQRLVRLLLEHSGICFEGYHKYSQEAGVLGGAQPINIPVARVPKDLNDHEQDAFMEAVCKEVLPVRLTLGSIKRRTNDEA